jgi:hypothetical protein
MSADVRVSYELNLMPAEDRQGWTAMIYRSVRAGICGPWSDTVEVPMPPGMFYALGDLTRAALEALKVSESYEAGAPEVYGRYGSVDVRVPLTRVERPHQLPVIDEGGRMHWIEVPMRSLLADYHDGPHA